MMHRQHCHIGQYISACRCIGQAPGTDLIVEAHKKRFPGCHMFFVTMHLLHLNRFLFLRMWCWKDMYVACHTISKHLPCSNKKSVYPNVHTLIKLMLTISLTTASVEHSLLKCWF